MSVIAKLMVRGVTRFGTGQLIELGCVCDNDLMAAYATSEEDKLFTKYSPWGEMKLNVPDGAVVDFKYEPNDGVSPPVAFYVMALAEAEHEFVQPTDSLVDPNFPGASAWAFVGCHSLTEFGGDTRQVEFRGGGGRGRGVDRLNWRMSVDNPGASSQFKAGGSYYLVLYPAAQYDRDAAIRAAHGHETIVPAEKTDDA